MYEIWYGITSIIFGALLFIPMRKIIYSMAYNRYTSKNKKEPTDEQAKAIKKRSDLIAGILSITFAFIYNKVVMFKYFGVGGR